MDRRITILLTLALFGLSSVAADSMDKVRGILQSCSDKFGINKDEFLKEVKEYRFPDDDNTKCALACFMEETTMMKDLKLNVPVVQAMNKMKYDDPNVVAQGDKIVMECEPMVNSSGEKNNCQQAWIIAKCVIDKAEKVNFPIHQGH